MSSSKPRAPLSGARKAAALLTSLDRAAQAHVLKNLDARAVADITAAMRELSSSIEAREVDGLYAELARALHAESGPRAPRDDELRALLDAALGKDKGKGVLDAIEERRRHERPFDSLEKHPVSVVTRVLVRESAAVVALVLAHVSPERSAELLAAFDADRALDVVWRMARLEPPPYDMLALVARELAAHASVEATRPESTRPERRLETIAQMLVRTPSGMDRSVLSRMEAADKDTANGIRERMFAWNDLATVDRRGMQRILSSIETRTLAVALKGSTQALQDNVLSNLSQRVQAMVAEEREVAGPMPLQEVEIAREEILRSVRELLESGQLASPKEAEELVR